MHALASAGVMKGKPLDPPAERRMMRFLSRDILLVALTALGLVQVSLLLYGRAESETAPSGWLEAGDLLPESVVARAFPEGPGPSTTVLLVYHSECAHSRSVAGAWRDWAKLAPSGVGVVGVSSEPPPAAQAYALAQGWDWGVLQAEGPTGSRVHALTARTPWVFVVDGEGRIMVEGHGSRLSELTEVLPGVQGE